MKVNKSVEQGIYVLCILALQKNHTSVKSFVLSDLLQVSDSYLKKLLSKMVKAGLISSSASKMGGYKLNKKADEITIYDVFSAFGEDQDVLTFQHLSQHIFPDQEHAMQSEQMIEQAFERGFNELYGELKKIRIADLLKQEYVQGGFIDWNEHSA